MKASVIVPYYPHRYTQFQRTKYLLERQTYGNYDVWVIDDGGNDCDAPPLELENNFHYIKLRERGTAWRPLNTALRCGFEYCDGDFIIIALAEVMPPKDAIEKLINHPKKDCRPVPNMYHLVWKHYKILDEIAWKYDLSNLLVFNLMSERTPWGYINAVAFRYRHHFNFSGQTREWWERIGEFPNTNEPMMDEPWLHRRELELGIPSYGIDFAVYHQWHERGDKQYSTRIQRIRDQKTT